MPVAGKVDARVSMATSTQDIAPASSAGADNMTASVADLLFILSANQVTPFLLNSDSNFESDCFLRHQ